MARFTRTTPPPIMSTYGAKRIITPSGGVVVVPKTASKQKVQTLLEELAEKERLKQARGMLAARGRHGIQTKVKAAIARHEAEESGVTIEPEEAARPTGIIRATPGEINKATIAKAKADEKGWKCYTQINTYKVKTMDGGLVIVEALDAKTAKAKAKEAGYKVAWVAKKMPGEEIKPSKAKTGAFQVTTKEGETTTMVPYTDPETKETSLIPKDTAAQLRETPAYKGATAWKTDAQRLGIAYAAAQRDFENQLKTKSPDLYKIYKEEGIGAYNRAVAKAQQGFIDNLQKQYPVLYEAYSKGWITLDEIIEQQSKAYAKFQAKVASGEVVKLSDGTFTTKEWADLEKGLLSRSNDSQRVIINIALSPEPQRSEVLKWAHTPESERTEKPPWVIGKGYSELNTEQKLKVLEYYRTQVQPGPLKVTKEYLRVRVEPLIAITPVVGTAYYWNKMDTAGRILSIVGDVACLSFIVKAASASARAARGYTATARVKAAIKGAKEMSLAEIVAPLEAIANPIETTKGIGRQIQSTVETLIHPKKLPLGSAELTYTTTRLPVEDVGGAAKAMELRDAAVGAAIQGKPATATVGDITLTLNPSELQKVGGAMAIHATPDIRPYMNGAIIGTGPSSTSGPYAFADLFISPNFHSRFAQATSIGEIPEGGIKGGLIIRDQNVLKAIAPTGQVYMSTVEMEAMVKTGTVLPPPSQVLFTRDVAGNKLTLLVIGEPFTQAQIAKLKFLGSLDTIGQIFKPTMTLTGAQRTAISSMDDIISLAGERANIAQQLTTARAAGRTAQAQTLGQRIADIDQRISALVERVNAPREVVRPSDIVWAEYADKGVLERWRELNPKEATRTYRGTRLPDIEAGRIIRQARATREERRMPARERLAPAREREAPARTKPPTYDRLSPPRYTPPYVPPYTPPYAPPYVPTKTPSYAPPHVPLYRPPRIPPLIPLPKGPPKKSPTMKIGLPTRRERIPTEQPGLVSWRQGMYYVTIVEPYRTTGTKPDVIYSRHKPPWGRVAKGRRSPQKTLQAIGRRHPQSILLPMGATRAVVLHGRTLRFGRARGRRR